MTANDGYIVEYHDERHDYLKSARKVRICYQHPIPFTAEELATLAITGKYIRHDDLRDMERDDLEMLLLRVRAWAEAPYRIAQFLHPDVRKMRPYVELEIDTEFCERAQAKAGSFLTPEEVEPLPLRGCWRSTCWCHYRTYSRSELTQLGRLPDDDH